MRAYKYVCVYVCVCVCMTLCMYVCMSVYIYVFMYVFMFVCMYICRYISMYVWMCMCVCWCRHICMYACIYVCLHVWIYVCVYVCIYECMYLWTNVCMYVCVYFLPKATPTYIITIRAYILTTRHFTFVRLLAKLAQSLYGLTYLPTYVSTLPFPEADLSLKCAQPPPHPTPPLSDHSPATEGSSRMFCDTFQW